MNFFCSGMVAIALFLSASAISAPDEPNAKRLLEALQKSLSPHIAQQLAEEVSKEGWRNWELLYDCLHELRSSQRTGLKIDFPQPSGDIHRLIRTAEGLPTISAREFLDYWIVVSLGIGRMTGVRIAQYKILTMPMTAAQRKALFIILRRNVSGAMPDQGFLPSEGRNSDLWAQERAGQMRSIHSSIEAKLIAFAKLSGLADKDEQAGYEARRFLRSLQRASSDMVQIRDPATVREGTALAVYLEQTSNAIVSNIAERIRFNQSASPGDAQMLGEALLSICSKGAPAEVPQFIDVERLLKQVR